VVLGPPVTAIFACLFLDGLAAHIETRDYPDKAARPSFARTLRAGLRFAGLVLGANLVLLPLEFTLPGVGELLSVAVNGWLLDGNISSWRPCGTWTFPKPIACAAATAARSGLREV